MEIDRDTVMPERWRNRLFKFAAGGYDGNIWHVAFVLVDGEGHLYWAGNDGCGKVKDLAETLEREFVRHEDVSWDHEFQEYDISTRENVIGLCKSLATYRDVGIQANVANMLTVAGYDGAGCTCSDCGEFFEFSELAYDPDEDCGGFHNCVDSGSYAGCGGLAVEMTRIVCDECRATSECGACWDLSIPVRKGTHEADVERMDFAARFGYGMAGVCEYCWDRFVRRHDRKEREYRGPKVPETDYEMERIPGDVRICDLLEALEEAEGSASSADPEFAAECWKYFDWKRRVEGLPSGEAFGLMTRVAVREPDNLRKFGHGFARKLVENLVGRVAKAHFDRIDRCLMDDWEPHDLEGAWTEFLELGKEKW